MFHLGSTAVVFVEERAHGRFATEPGAIRMGAPLVVPGHAASSTNGTTNGNDTKSANGGARG